MIKNPLETIEIHFKDWDDTVIGVLRLPSVVEDARPFVNFFVGVNMIHPDLQRGIVDPWAAERKEKFGTAKKDWPRNRIYPEESWFFEMGKNGLKIRHSLRYVPAEPIKAKRALSFRPTKKGE